MASVLEYRRIGWGAIAVGSTAVLVWFGTGLDPWWPLMWFAPLPVLLFASGSSWPAASVVGALGWVFGNGTLWDYYHRVLHAPSASLLPLFALWGLVFTTGVLLYRALLRRGAPWAALIALPTTWVSFEYLLNLTWPHGSASSLAYSQLKFLPFLQLASITGPWGMSLLLLLFPSAIAVAAHLRRTAPNQALRVSSVSGGAIALVLLFGAVRLSVPSRGASVKVGLAASDLSQNAGVADEGPRTLALFRAYADQAVSLAAQGAQIIVLPEKLGVAVDPDTAEADAVFQPVANSTHADIVVGLVHVSPPLKYNEARVYSPEAPVIGYHKQHLLPPFESKLEPGTQLTLLTRSSGTWGVAICKDMDFAMPSRKYGELGTGLLLVPAWDFVVDRLEHGHLALMRGVESGFSIVRAAKEGYLTVSDDRGRVLAETTSDSAPFATLVSTVPVQHDGTVYLMFGDWAAWLTLAMLAFTVAQLGGRRLNPLAK